MANDGTDFQIEYAFTSSSDGQERLDQAYDLILNLILASHQIPEEGVIDALSIATDVGDKIHTPSVRESRSLGAIHAR